MMNEFYEAMMGIEEAINDAFEDHSIFMSITIQSERHKKEKLAETTLSVEIADSSNNPIFEGNAVILDTESFEELITNMRDTVGLWIAQKEASSEEDDD